jgi:hypothetical protein
MLKEKESIRQKNLAKRDLLRKIQDERLLAQ